MSRPASPRFTLADLMILIFATGFGLGCYVLLDDSLLGGQRFVFGIFQSPPKGWSPFLIVDRVAGGFALAVTVFGGWTIAVPALTLRRPRHQRRRMIRGPGLTACIAATAGLAACVGAAGLAFTFQRWFNGLTRFYQSLGLLIDDVFILAGIAVAGAWAAQLASGRWRPTRDGFDRIGRFLGGLWMASGLVSAVRQLLQQ